MATSKFAKKTKAIRRIASGAGVGSSTTRMQLNRDWLIAEHKVNVAVSQANAGVDPTSVDVRDFIQSVAVETSDGRRVFLTGAQVYDLGRFTENSSAVISSLGAVSTANFSFELHHENDGALLDLLTALRSNELTTLDLVINWATDALNGFKGGTAPAVAAYNVTVESYDYEMLTETTGGVQLGVQLGSFKHFQERQEASGATTGQQPDFQLVTGNATRFVMFHTYNTAGAVPVLADGIIGNMRVNINGRDYRVTTFADTRNDNIAARGFNLPGVCVLDFGDDEVGFLDLTATNQARVQYDVLAGAPAAWNIQVAQDYTRKS